MTDTKAQQRKKLRRFWIKRSLLVSASCIALGIAVPRIYHFPTHWAEHSQRQTHLQNQETIQELTAQLREIKQAPEWNIAQLSSDSEGMKPRQAQEILTQALNLVQTIDHPYSKAEALSSIAQATGQVGDPDKAHEILTQALNLAQTIDNIYSKAEALSSIAQATGQVGDPDKAHEILTQSLNLAQTIDNIYSKAAEALSSIAQAYEQVGDPNKAQELLTQAFNLAQTIDGIYSKAEALSSIAQAYGQMGDPDKAYKILTQAFNLAQTIDRPRDRAMALHPIAQAIGQVGDPDKAYKILTQALDLAQTIDRPQDKTYALSNIAHAYGQVRSVTFISQEISTLLKESNSSIIPTVNLPWETLLLIIPTLSGIIFLFLIIRQKNPVNLSGTGQLIVLIPEDYVANLTLLKQRMQREHRSDWYIRLRLIQETVEILKALYIQIPLDNLGLPSIERRIDE